MRATAALLLLAALVCPGCLEGRDTVTLAKDGSGTFVGRYVVDLAQAKELGTAAAAVFGGGGGGMEPGAMDDKNPFAAAWFREFGKEVKGFEVKGGKESVAGEKRTNTVEATFTSIEAAARAYAFFTSTVTLAKVDPSETVPTGAWKLVFEEALLSNPEATGGFDLRGILPMFEGQLKALQIGRTITLPCKALSTNGETSEDGLTVSWTVTYDKILEGKGLKAEVVFAATEGLDLKPFSFSPDPMVLARRFFESPPVEEPAPVEPGSKDGEGDDKGDGAGDGR